MSGNGEKAIEAPVGAWALRAPAVVRPVLLWILVAGAAAGFASFAGRIVGGSTIAELATGDTFLLIIRLVASCGVTAAFEEMVFRGALLGVLLYRLQRLVRAPFAASVIAALVFALLHISPEVSLVIEEPVLALPAVLKFVQAALFGFCMGAVVVEMKSLLIVVGVHWLFDVLYFWPTYLYEGCFPAGYVVGDWASLIVLGVSVLLFLPSVIAAWRLPSLGMVGFSRR